jgi:hypothetical protein
MGNIAAGKRFEPINALPSLILIGILTLVVSMSIPQKAWCIETEATDEDAPASQAVEVDESPTTNENVLPFADDDSGFVLLVGLGCLGTLTFVLGGIAVAETLRNKEDS